jgi:septal ring factor EnvC (AmiA/AmiB activator)
MPSNVIRTAAGLMLAMSRLAPSAAQGRDGASFFILQPNSAEAANNLRTQHEVLKTTVRHAEDSENWAMEETKSLRSALAARDAEVTRLKAEITSRDSNLADLQADLRGATTENEGLKALAAELRAHQAKSSDLT